MGCCFSVSDAVEVDQYLQESQERKLQQLTPIPHLPQNDNLKVSQSQFLENDGEKLKLLGNQNFKNRNYTAAIKYYRQAIATSKSDISYYSNLALALKANSQYKQSIQIIDQMICNPQFRDQRTSVIFAKGKLVKARSIMLIVKSYCLQGKFSQKSNHQHLLLINGAIQILEELTSQSNKLFQNQEYLSTGLKLKQFLVNEVIPKSQTQNFVDYLTKKFKNQHQQGFSQNEQQIGRYFKNKGEIISQLMSIVQSLKASVVQEEKQYLIDPITYEYLSNAVIVPSGITYNQQTLKQHFKNNGYNDSMTHQVFEVGEKVVVRNNNLQKLAIQQKKSVSKDDLQFLKY